MRVYVKDIRAAKLCSKGARKWFERHNLSWADFLREGMDEDDVLKIGDAMAARVVEVARERR